MQYQTTLHPSMPAAAAQAARSNEMQFFQSNPAYAGCSNIGTDFLSNKLSTQLIRSIQQQLPVITSSIDNGCAFFNQLPGPGRRQPPPQPAGVAHRGD